MSLTEVIIMQNEFNTSIDQNLASEQVNPEIQSNDETISLINGLIETCRDGQEGFKQAAEGISRSDIKTAFYEFSQQRASFVGELQDIVRTLGGDPENSGSIAGTLHRGWMNIKATVAGDDDQAILNECERGEDAAKDAYDKALKQELPAYIRQTLQTQNLIIVAAHDRVKELRDHPKDAQSSTAKSGF